MKRYAYIDALRGIAVLGVIVVHVASAAPIADGPLKILLQQGARGVQLFYVVSAFTLALSWHARHDGASAFFIRRLFRIAPMYWLAIPIYLLFAGLGAGFFAPSSIYPAQIVATILFVSAVVPIVPVVPGGLTVTTEMALYILFPLLITVIRSRLIALLALALSVYVAIRIYEPSIPLLLRWGADQSLVGVFAFFLLPYQLPVFLAGIAAFQLSDLALPRIAMVAVLVASAVATVVLPFCPEVLPLHIEYGFAFAGILISLANGVGRRLAVAPLCYLGKWSFSAYLLHFAVFNLLYLARDAGYDPFGIVHEGSAWRLVPLLAAVLTVTGFFSCLTYHTIERPLIAVGNRLVTALCGKGELREQIS